MDLAGYQKPLMKNRQSRGGGVMLYVKDHIGAIHRSDLEHADTEVLWVELRLKNKRVVFATCYRPPGIVLAGDPPSRHFGRVYGVFDGFWRGGHSSRTPRIP